MFSEVGSARTHSFTHDVYTTDITHGPYFPTLILHLLIIKENVLLWLNGLSKGKGSLYLSFDEIQTFLTSTDQNRYKFWTLRKYIKH